ncbi:MAG: hypothetical protein ACHRXM_24345 [Isosphaerales bacterium]
MHTAGLAQFLARAAYEVKHYFARYPAWGIGRVTDELIGPSEALEFDEGSRVKQWSGTPAELYDTLTTIHAVDQRATGHSRHFLAPCGRIGQPGPRAALSLHAPRSTLHVLAGTSASLGPGLRTATGAKSTRCGSVPTVTSRNR